MVKPDVLLTARNLMRAVKPSSFNEKDELHEVCESGIKVHGVFPWIAEVNQVRLRL